MPRADRVQHAVEERDPCDSERWSGDLALAEAAKLAGERLVELALCRVDATEERPEPRGLGFGTTPPGRSQSTRADGSADALRQLPLGPRPASWTEQRGAHRAGGADASSAPDPAADRIRRGEGLVPNEAAVHGMPAQAVGPER